MTNTTKLVLAFSVTGLLFSGSAMAQVHHRGPMTCPSAIVGHVVGQNEAMERMLALKPDQREAFKKYADVRQKIAQERSQWRDAMKKKVPVDYQGRLEIRADHMEKAGMQYKHLAAARAEFLKALDSQQRLTLELMESKHGYGLMGNKPHKIEKYSVKSMRKSQEPHLGHHPGKKGPGHQRPYEEAPVSPVKK